MTLLISLVINGYYIFIKAITKIICHFKHILITLKLKTGKTPVDFKKLAEKKGFLKKGELVPTVKATQITNWLKEDFELGHGHAMAIYATFKGKKE